MDASAYYWRQCARFVKKKIHFIYVGNKINGFNVTIARNGVGCLLLLLLLPNGRALTTHGTQKGNAILCSLLIHQSFG